MLILSVVDRSVQTKDGTNLYLLLLRVLDQHAEWDFYSASSLKQQSAGRHVAPLVHIILIPTSLCSYSLIMHAWRSCFLFKKCMENAH
jgi:hypothetical protein